MKNPLRNPERKIPRTLDHLKGARREFFPTFKRLQRSIQRISSKKGKRKKEIKSER